MGQPVVHFEVVGRRQEAPEFYGELAGWKFDVYEGGPGGREGNTNSEESGSAGA